MIAKNEPTYSTDEVLDMALTLDREGLVILVGLINEEKKRYSLMDLYTIQSMIELRPILRSL